MKVTAREIRQREFSHRFRGCDPREVETFLTMVASQVEDLNQENVQLREALAKKEEEIQGIQEAADAWDKVLMAVQQTRAALLERGAKQAQVILAQAERQAHQIVTHAEKTYTAVDHEVQQLVEQRHRLRCHLRYLLEQHLKLMKRQLGRDEAQRFDKSYRHGVQAGTRPQGSDPLEPAAVVTRSSGGNRGPHTAWRPPPSLPGRTTVS